MSFWPYAAQLLSSLVFIRQIGRQGIPWDKEKSDLRLWRQKLIYFLQFSKLTFFSAHPHVLFFAQWCCSFYKRSCHKEEISCATSYGDLISQPRGRDSSHITTWLSALPRLCPCLHLWLWMSCTVHLGSIAKVPASPHVKKLVTQAQRTMYWQNRKKKKSDL